MKTGTEGIELIKHFEGFYPTAYLCPAGKLTIGYGHTKEAGPPVVNWGDRVTEPEACNILRRDLTSVETDVFSAITASLTQCQFDALVSFTFNLGIGALRRSTLRKIINAGGDGELVAREFVRWNKCGGKPLAGLTRRRRAEAALWNGEDWSAFT